MNASPHCPVASFPRFIPLGTFHLILACAASISAATVAGREVLTAQQLKRLSVEQLLEQEVVSVSRRPEVWRQAASNVFLINGSNPAAMTTLPQALRLAPNLFVAQGTAGLWGINARGFVRANSFSNKLLVLIDGRTVYSPLFSNVFWDSTDIFMPDLATIEVISGPAGSNWGSNAVNGVINIQTKSAHETLGGLVYGTIGTEQNDAGVRYGTNFGRNGAVRVYAKHRWYDHSRPNHPGDPEHFDSGDFTQAGFRADWGAPDSGAVTLQGDVFRSEFETRHLGKTLNEGWNILARWSRNLSRDANVWVRFFHDHNHRHVARNIDQTTRSTDLEFQHRTQLASGHLFLWGANFRLLQDQVSDTLGFAILPPSLDFNLGGAFAQHEMALGESARLITGLRLEHNHFSGWEYQPTLRLAWSRDARTAWLAASRSTRIPSRLESGFFAPATPPFFIAGGPDIRAEVVHAYEAGIRFQPRAGLSVTATAYLHEYSNLRTVELKTPIVQENNAEGRIYGLEIFADYDVTRDWRMRFGGFINDQDTWVRAGSTDAERGVGEASYPNFQLQLRNSFHLGGDVIFWSAIRHVDDIPLLAGGSLRSLPAYTELDARLTWQATPRLEVSLLGRNLLDASHPEIGHNVDSSLRAVEREVQLMLQWQF